MRRHALKILGLVLLASGCVPRPEQAPADSIRSARQAALMFEQRMAREVIARLERDEDPVAVWLAYADHVPDWGREISNEVKVDFSRTALTVRNPANAPDDWERRQMEQMSFILDTGLDPERLDVAEILEEDGQKIFRWMQPILMSEDCLACHGEQIDPRIRLLLGQEYPLDEALEYSAGQLGGAYSVRQVLGVGGKPPPPWQEIPPPLSVPADERAPDDAPLITAPAPALEPLP